jgi:hypothetical protein
VRTAEQTEHIVRISNQLYLCHSSCISRSTRFGNDQTANNNNWQRLCSPLPPVPVTQPAQLLRKSATHSRRRRRRQPHTSGAHTLHSTVRTTVRVHRAAWISNRFQLAIHFAPLHAHASAATRTLNDQPWPACVQIIAGKSWHRNAPSGQQSGTRCASIQTTVVRTTRAPLGSAACVTLGRVQSRNCRNSEPDQAHISNTNLDRRSSTPRITSVAATPSFSTENTTEQGDSQLLSYRIQEGYVRCLNRNTTPNQPQLATGCFLLSG